MFQLTTGRSPTAKEARLLQDSLSHYRAEFTKRIADARRLVECGESLSSSEQDGAEVVELAAFTTIANMLLNLDETVTQH